MLGLGLNSSLTASNRFTYVNKYSLSFDNTNDVVSLESSGLRGALNNGDFEETGSISVWAKFVATTDNGMVCDFAVDANNRIFILYKHSNDTISCSYRAGGTTKIASLDPSGVEGEGWFHIAFTWDSTGTAKAYIDAATAVTNSISSLTWSGNWDSATVDLGESNSGGSDFWGFATDFAVFDRELTATEITNIYNGGKPKDETSKDPIAYWRIEEGTGSTITDISSGKDYSGTISGAAWSTDIP